MDIHDRGSLRPRVLEAQVPSVARSHRSQGPIGPPKVSHPRYPTQGIPGNPYMVWFSSIGIIQWHWNNSVEFHWIQWNSIGSNGIPLDPMEFHWIQWNSMGSNGIPLDPMEFHWIQWNSIGSNGIPLDPME